ncbi:DmsC/YnfH family molybdoenzyme membrane anchor subunit [Sulfurisphaera ohwakuensis]|uniref:DmsC/YnfH family molybdoenzyme membrane anchor subunit n=1 Tax=Sulfurisphaera ohwakuensis TaxID=69656 RepID=UPI0036F2B61E
MERSLGFIFDPNKCIVCNACVNACNEHYGNLNWRSLLVFQNEVKIGISIACNHCDNPLCMKVCPANAIHKDDMGIVYINGNECIGCGYCQWACPYEEPKFNHEGIMTKCDLCRQRILKKEGLPYCVESCPTGALSFGWIDKPKYDAPYLAPYDITKPKLEIKKPKEEEIKASPLKRRREERYIELLLFTILSELSLGILITRIPFYSLISLILLAIGLVPSIFHVNRRERAYRVIMNLKSSWLSREVFFGGLSFLSLLLELVTPSLYYLSVILISLSVFSSIMIYMLKTTPSWYNPNTPLSFIGTIFTVFPLGFYFTHSLLFLLIPLVFGVIEIGFARKEKILHIPYLILLIISIFIPLISILASLVGISSEIIARRNFFEKITYYGLPSP